MAPSDEQVLIEEAQRGQRAAFAALVERYWDRLYRWLYHLSHDRHAAEDIAQETFLKALGALSGFKPTGSFQAWLFRIGHNVLANHQRARRHKLQALPEDLTGKEKGPLEQTLSKETMWQLTRAVGRLPTEFRAAFLLRVEEDMSFQTIAEVLDITAETARWRVFKARQKLMDVLARQLEKEQS